MDVRIRPTADIHPRATESSRSARLTTRSSLSVLGLGVRISYKTLKPRDAGNDQDDTDCACSCRQFIEQNHAEECCTNSSDPCPYSVSGTDGKDFYRNGQEPEAKPRGHNRHNPRKELGETFGILHPDRPGNLTQTRACGGWICSDGNGLLPRDGWVGWPARQLDPIRPVTVRYA